MRPLAPGAGTSLLVAQGEPPPLSLSLQLDQCLQEDFPVYKTFRLKGSIGPVRLHLVAAGAFRELRDAAGPPGPMARVLRERRPLHFIQSRVVS